MSCNYVCIKLSKNPVLLGITYHMHTLYIYTHFFFPHLSHSASVWYVVTVILNWQGFLSRSFPLLTVHCFTCLLSLCFFMFRPHNSTSTSDFIHYMFISLFATPSTLMSTFVRYRFNMLLCQIKVEESAAAFWQEAQVKQKRENEQ